MLNAVYIGIEMRQIADYEAFRNVQVALSHKREALKTSFENVKKFCKEKIVSRAKNTDQHNNILAQLDRAMELKMLPISCVI